MRRFEVSDRYTVADIGLEVEGDSLAELFLAAAEGMFAIILGAYGPATHTVTIPIHLRAETHEQLLVDWLSELIFLFDARQLAPVDIHLTLPDAGRPEMDARVECRPFDRDLDHAEHEIKAVTYHRLKIERTDGSYRCHLVFDI